MQRAILKAAVLAASLFSAPVHAMTFETITTGVGPAVVGQGEIMEGDAQRLRDALAQIPRDETGQKLLALNSPGGSVQAALRMGDVIDDIGVNTFVPPGAICASACAAVVFISGHYNMVLPGGRLGMHSCYDGNTREMKQLCNDAIADRALSQGISYGSIKAFMFRTPPGEMLWFDQEQAECWGLVKRPGLPPHHEPCVIETIKNLMRE